MQSSDMPGIREASAPSYDALRPLKARTTATFPVYHDLPAWLAKADTHPDATVAHVLATCAGYAYSDVETVAMMMARMGLEDNACRAIDMAVDAMFIQSTAFVVQSGDGRAVIVAYRGTEPVNLINWLTDADVHPEKVPFSFPDGEGEFPIHGGFYRNVLGTRHEVVSALQRAEQGKSVKDEGGSVPNPMEALYITGHSLGGAMAALLAVMLTTDASYAELAEKLRGVYTFGQPMVGSPGLAAACEAVPFLCDNVIRYVYRRDVVPALPPTLSGPFAHFGQEYHYRGTGAEARWRHREHPQEQAQWLAQLLLAPLSFVARQFQVTRGLRLLRYGLDEHRPQHYISALTPEGVRDEFGE